MADFDSSLPIRTENAGDVVAKIADATTPSQQLAVDASGKIEVKIDDSAGNGLTSTNNAGKQSLDVNITGGSSSGAATDGDAFTYGSSTETPVGGVFNDTGATLTSGKTGALRLTAERGLHVNLRNAAGSEIGTSGAPVRVDPTGTTAQPVTDNGGSLTVDNNGTFAVQATVAAGATNIAKAEDSASADGDVGVPAMAVRKATPANTSGTDGDYEMLQMSAGRLWTSATVDAPLPAGNNNIGDVDVVTQPARSHTTDSIKVGDGTDFLAISAAGEANVIVTSPLPAGTNNIGKTSIQDSSGAAFSESNPLPVFIADSTGTEINDYDTQATLASGASDNHDYTVTALKTLKLTQIEASASGKLKIEVQIETGVATGVFNTRFVMFNSTANPNISLSLREVISVAAGVRVRVIRTNKDNQSQDVYSTVSGHEI